MLMIWNGFSYYRDSELKSNYKDYEKRNTVASTKEKRDCLVIYFQTVRSHAEPIVSVNRCCLLFQFPILKAIN